MGPPPAGAGAVAASATRGRHYSGRHRGHRGCMLAASTTPFARIGPLTMLLASWRTRLGWISMLLTLALTWGSLWAIGRTFEHDQPVESTISSVAVLNPEEGKAGRSLRVEVTTPPPGNCVRMTTELLYQDSPGIPTYYQLGTTFNGSGFGARGGSLFGMPVTPGRPLTFAVVLSIPASIPDGKYQFIYRNLYTCAWFAGLVVWRIQYEVPPVPVWVGPH
jgi:hypothetical protein